MTHKHTHSLHLLLSLLTFDFFLQVIEDNEISDEKMKLKQNVEGIDCDNVFFSNCLKQPNKLWCCPHLFTSRQPFEAEVS